jgi:MazG family protein
VAIDRLLEIMVRLRDPVSGCPWDRQQTWATIAPHTIEEAYELEDAIAEGEPARVRDELGDLLFQVVCQARIAEEQGAFDFDGVVESICDKLTRRHPHVFGDELVADVAELSQAWESHKARERAGRGSRGTLDGVAVGLPALTRAAKLGLRAARVGFDWHGPGGVLDKVREELVELDAAVATGDARATLEEIGDLFFSVAQLARHLGADPESVLRDANRKFEARFRFVEQALAAQGRATADATPAELEALWDRAKQQQA